MSQQDQRPSLAAHCPETDLRARLEEALDPRRDVRWEDDWKRFSRYAPKADCCIIAWARTNVAARDARLTVFGNRHPLLPLVLVTRRDAHNLRRVSQVPIAEIVWIQEMAATLGPAIVRARGTLYFYRLADRIGSRTDLPLPLRKALMVACRSEAPPASVTELARLVDRDRKTIWYHWTNVLGAAQPIHLKNFLVWLRLLRAAGLKQTGVSWQKVARDLGTNDRTLRAQARRVTGWTLSELKSAGQVGLWNRFAGRLEGTYLEDLIRWDESA